MTVRAPIAATGATFPEPAGFADALAHLAEAVRAAGDDPQVYLQIITDGVVELVPAVTAAAVVTSAGPSRLQPVAVCGELPAQIMGLQNELGEGPCLQAVGSGEVVRVGDLSTDARWPLFRAGVERAQLPVRSMICTPLTTGRAPKAAPVAVGALCVASPTRDGFAVDDELVGVFAAHARVALDGVADRHNFLAALATRDVIGQAKGILMERHRITEVEAFQRLVVASQQTNRKVREVCIELCDTGALPGTGG